MTQAALILAELEAHPDQFVPMPVLAERAGCYAVHSRIADLRRDGHLIENRVSGLRPRRSAYRLIVDPQRTLSLD